jgi:U4/U6.U5 tri-snRNP component SNU23
MSKQGAYGIKATDTDFRRKWDKEEYAEKAKKKDEEERERARENEERAKQGMSCPRISHWFKYLLILMSIAGKKPLKGKKTDLPKPTELMQRRDYNLELDKNLNKTMVVNNPGGRGPGQPGFYCETCNRTYKDSTGYLDHINGRARTLLNTLCLDLKSRNFTC